MKTDVIQVSSEGFEISEALDLVDRIAEYKNLSTKAALRLRLLAEETMSMMREIVGGAEGEFWIVNEGDVYEVHLRVETLVDEQRRAQLLSASTTGQNEATRTFMGKIRSFFEPSYCVPMFRASPMGYTPRMYNSMDWSMEDYKSQLKEYRQQQKEGAQEEWDELEKSVISHAADDVRVSIRGRTVELVILKAMA